MTQPHLGNQRWLYGLDHYRPPAEPIRTQEYDVSEIDGDAAAKAFIAAHHYSGTYPAARWRFGLFRRGELVGMAVFSHPCNDNVLTNVFGGSATDSVELGRFVLQDQVPGNGETWFLARCFARLKREGLAGVVAFSDPCKRQSRTGALVFAGHVGTIYQAHNSVYLGRGTARTLSVLPDGSVFSDRTQQKVRGGERGLEGAIAILVRHGARRPVSSQPENLRGWLREWRERLCQRQRHPGNHKYAWALQRSVTLPASKPYPKMVDHARSA